MYHNIILSCMHFWANSFNKNKTATKKCFIDKSFSDILMYIRKIIYILGLLPYQVTFNI